MEQLQKAMPRVGYIIFVSVCLFVSVILGRTLHQKLDHLAALRASGLADSSDELLMSASGTLQTLMPTLSMSALAG
jgi:hypothetical protein